MMNHPRTISHYSLVASAYCLVRRLAFFCLLFCSNLAIGEIELPIVGQSLTFTDGQSSIVSNSAKAAFLNVTAVQPSSSGYVTVYPCSTERPLASNLNYVAGDIVANGVIAPIGSDGRVCIYSFTETDIVVDILGWIEGEGFTSVTPLRLLDTRVREPLQAGDPLSLEVVSPAYLSSNGASVSPGGELTAMALNVTVVDPKGSGYVTAYACGESIPFVSTLNYTAGQVVANGAVVPVSTDGSVCFYSSQTTELIIDVLGWFEGESFTPVDPSRLIDTRIGLGSDVGVLRRDDTIDISLRGAPLTQGGLNTPLPSNAEAVAINVVSVLSEGPGYMTVYPCGRSRPLSSNLNYVAGDVIANNVIAPVGEDGSVCLYSFVNTDAVVDIVGWFERSDTTGFVPVVPKRLLDTRDGFVGNRVLKPVGFQVKSGGFASIELEVREPISGSIRIVSGGTGFAAVRSSGDFTTLTYQPGRGFTGIDSVVLALTDSGGVEREEQIDFVVYDASLAPTARIIGPDSVVEGDLVILRGDSSSAPQGNLIEYRWEQVDGPKVSFQQDGPTIVFNAPIASNSQVVFELTVLSERRLPSDAVQVSMTIQDALSRTTERQEKIANYEYDALGRLTRVLQGDQEIEYIYDSAGNILGINATLTSN